MSEPEVEPKHETTRLGSYTIVRKLARGGMAELYLARSVGPEGFEKLVVLKKILPRYAENPRFVQLFLDEAKLAASLDHPHIAHVYDMGRVDGHYFFTMEYVYGQDLRSILRRTERGHRKTPIELAVQIVRNVASALHYAHERRRPDGTLRDIVHRDVSPSNILVSYDGAIKLVDFGVAKTAASSVRTRTGTLKGKVGYMSPEQARGMPIDRRSDVFSLGVVLWELVAIKRLFKCDNDLATIQSIINSPAPSLVELRDDCPAELERISKRALEKDPATRYQTAQELQRDLEELAREQRLNQSSIALSGYLGELFETEIAAFREAQSSGVTVTDYVVQTDLTTPVSESDLEVDESDVDDELEDDEPEDDEPEDEDEAADASVPPQPATAGIITNDAELEATAIGGPPLMLDSQVTKVQLDAPFEAAATEVHENPFLDNGSTAIDQVAFNAKTAVRPNPFGDELPTDHAPFPEDLSTVRLTPGMLAPGMTSSVVVQPQTPPIGVPTMPPPGMAMHRVPSASSPPMQIMATPQQPYPTVSSMPHAMAPPDPQLASINLTPQKQLVILGAVAIGLLLLVVIVAVIAGGGSSSEPAEVPPDTAQTQEAPRPAPTPKVEPARAAAPVPKPVAKPEAAAKPEPTEEPPAAVGSGSGSANSEVKRPVKTFKPPRR